MVWMCGKKEGMEKEIKSTSKSRLYYPLSTGGTTEAEQQFTQIPLSLAIVRAKNFYLPVLNINRKAIPLYYYICYLFHLVFSFKSASDLHKHVETLSDSGAYSCDGEGCGFISWTSRQHCKRVHVVSAISSRIKCISVNETEVSNLRAFGSVWINEIFYFCIKSGTYLCTFLGVLQVLWKYLIPPFECLLQVHAVAFSESWTLANLLQPPFFLGKKNPHMPTLIYTAKYFRDSNSMSPFWIGAPCSELMCYLKIGKLLIMWVWSHIKIQFWAAVIYACLLPASSASWAVISPVL